MKKRKTLKELTLMDRFLFAEAMEDTQTFENFLSILLERDIHLQHPPQTEKEFRNHTSKRSIRVDIYAHDEDDIIYDAEAQRENHHNLPKRSRFYQGVIDCNLLEPGEIDYNKLNDTYIIFITPFDYFGKGFYRYTFKEMCTEDPAVLLEDGTTRIFFNTRGTIKNGISDEIIALLQYIEHASTSLPASDRLKQIDDRIEQLKENEEVRVRFMQAWEEKIYDRLEGEKIGLQKGLNSTRKNLSLLLKSRGTIPQQLEDKIQQEDDLDVLDSWFMLAIECQSVDEFLEKMNTL